MWTGFVQSLLSFGLSELPEREKRSKQEKSPEKQHTGGSEERDFSKSFYQYSSYSGKTFANRNEASVLTRRNCRGASSFLNSQNKIREPCKMYFQFA